MTDVNLDLYISVLKGGVCGFVCCNISESSSEFVEQLGLIGLPHDVNVQSLFDPTGTGNDLTCFFFFSTKVHFVSLGFLTLFVFL